MLLTREHCFFLKVKNMKKKKLIIRLTVFIITVIVFYLIFHNWNAIISLFSG